MNVYYSLPLASGIQTLVFYLVEVYSPDNEITINVNKVLNLLPGPKKELLDKVQITSQRKFFGNKDYGCELPSIDSRAITIQRNTNALDLQLKRIWVFEPQYIDWSTEKIEKLLLLPLCLSRELVKFFLK